MLETLICLVVGVTDGDTISVRCGEQPQAIVRIADIDAPEKAQPFGTVSRQHLATLCFQREAVVRSSSKDRYGRAVGSVECDGKDMATEQVRAGLAWVYVKYAPKDSPLKPLEAQAREARVGLWFERERAVPPWTWRKLPRGALAADGESPAPQAVDAQAPQ